MYFNQGNRDFSSVKVVDDQLGGKALSGHDILLQEVQSLIEVLDPF
jgi:hypothetical protein